MQTRIAKEGLSSFEPSLRCEPAYCKGMLVGIIAAYMDLGLPFHRAIEMVAPLLPPEIISEGLPENYAGFLLQVRPDLKIVPAIPPMQPPPPKQFYYVLDDGDGDGPFDDEANMMRYIANEVTPGDMDTVLTLEIGGENGFSVGRYTGGDMREWKDWLDAHWTEQE